MYNMYINIVIKTNTYFKGDTLTNNTCGSSTLFMRTGVDCPHWTSVTITWLLVLAVYE